jgi:hypothetical protein
MTDDEFRPPEKVDPMPSNDSFRAAAFLTDRRRFLISAGLLIHAGCRTSAALSPDRLPAVTSRFSAGEIVSPVTLGTVGLTVESGADAVQQVFAQRLGTLVAGEIELTAAGVRVQPWSRGVSRLGAGSQMPGDSGSGMCSVPFSVPSAATPDGSSVPLPPGLSDQHPDPDRLLSIQVMDYRPWYPMSAALRLTVTEGVSSQPAFETSAEWRVTPEGISGGCLPQHHHKPRRWFCPPHNSFQPSADHNSPEALLRIIAQDVAGWFAEKTAPPVQETKSHRTTGSRWSVLSRPRRRL